MFQGMQSQTHDLSFTAAEVRKTFVSWEDGEADREWGCLMLLWEHARGVAPRPLRREIEGDRPVVVMERLPGLPLGNDPLTPGQTQSLGETLRRVYDVPLAAVVDAGIGERRYGPLVLPEVLRGWLIGQYDYSQCQDAALVTDVVEAALAWLGSPDVLPEPHLAGLGISDLNPANILWDGFQCRLVDFEDGGLTDPAYELADHVEHIAARLRGVFDPGALSEAVQLSVDERDRMLAYRPLWATFWLVMLLPGNGGFRRNPAGTTEAQARHFLGLIK